MKSVHPRDAPRQTDSVIISIATKADEDELSRLLTDSYTGSGDFTVLSQQYYHDHFAERSVVLVARADGLLVATMRAQIVHRSSDLDFEDEGHLDGEMIPALYLSRAATIRMRRTAGINSLLRMYCLQGALAMNLKCLLGFVYENAPRTRLMKGLGYRCTPLSKKGNAAFADTSQALFASLDLVTNGAAALDMLRSMSEESPTLHRWHGPSIADLLSGVS